MLLNPGCAPAQVISVNDAVNDFSTIQLYNSNGSEINKECLEYSYSLDGVNWSCWLSYNDAGKILFEIESDYFTKIKVNDAIGKVTIDNVDTENYSTSLFTCFDFTQLSKVTNNLYNPYQNIGNALGLYQALSDMVTNVVGLPIYYIKLKPNQNSKDITFKEYTLYDVDSIKQIKLVVKDGTMPSSKPEFSEFGFDFSTEWETEISKSTFATAFGDNAKPMEGDLIYIPMMKRMWLVSNSYDEKNEGLMWQSTVFKVLLSKYEEKCSVDLGDAQSFVDSLVQSKYEDLFGNNENKIAGLDFVSAPESSSVALYPIFESDAVRSYVKHSNGLKDINAKLVNFQTYTNNILITENAYDWTGLLDESFVIYQKQFCGEDGTVSFIIQPKTNFCKGTLMNVANISIDIDMTPAETVISINDLVSIKLTPTKTYFVYARWSRNMNIIELSAAEYSKPENMPDYLVQPFHYKYALDKLITSTNKYDIELWQQEKKDVTLYSFDGKITNIKVFTKYIDSVTEILQMYPTNGNILINDTARKFVEMTGLPHR